MRKPLTLPLLLLIVHVHTLSYIEQMEGILCPNSASKYKILQPISFSQDCIFSLPNETEDEFARVRLIHIGISEWDFRNSSKCDSLFVINGNKIFNKLTPKSNYSICYSNGYILDHTYEFRIRDINGKIKFYTTFGEEPNNPQGPQFIQVLFDVYKGRQINSIRVQQYLIESSPPQCNATMQNVGFCGIYKSSEEEELLTRFGATLKYDPTPQALTGNDPLIEEVIFPLLFFLLLIGSLAYKLASLVKSIRNFRQTRSEERERERWLERSRNRGTFQFPNITYIDRDGALIQAGVRVSRDPAPIVQSQESNLLEIQDINSDNTPIMTPSRVPTLENINLIHPPDPPPPYDPPPTYLEAILEMMKNKISFKFH